MGKRNSDPPKKVPKKGTGTSKRKGEGEGGNSDPPNESPNQRRRGAAEKETVPTSNATSRSPENELEALRQQVKELAEERAASKGAMVSLENANRLLEEKLSESQSGRAAQPTHPAGQKKKLIRRPKGSDWCLQDEIGLANDRPKYDRIIRALKSLKKEAGFKDGVLFKDQSRDKIVKYCKAARKRAVFLRRFKRDWATTAYLRRSLANRRGYLKKFADTDENGAGPSGTRHNNDDDDDDDGLGKEDDQSDFAEESEDDDDDNAMYD